MIENNTDPDVDLKSGEERRINAFKTAMVVNYREENWEDCHMDIMALFNMLSDDLEVKNKNGKLEVDENSPGAEDFKKMKEFQRLYNVLAFRLRNLERWRNSKGIDNGLDKGWPEYRLKRGFIRGEQMELCKLEMYWINSFLKKRNMGIKEKTKTDGASHNLK